MGYALIGVRIHSFIHPPYHCAVLVSQGKTCKFCRDYFVFYPCILAQRYTADPCKLTILSLQDEYSYRLVRIRTSLTYGVPTVPNPNRNFGLVVHVFTINAPQLKGP
jgi:hypothetical protein